MLRIHDTTGDCDSIADERQFPSRTLTLLTLNLGVPAIRVFGLGQICLAPNISERLAATPRHLRSVEADVIALQEVYAEHHRIFLKNSLSESHPHICVAPTRKSIFGSGLMFLSRHPIVDGAFIPMKGARLSDRAVSDKGCLWAEIDVPKLGQLRFINVHLAPDSISKLAPACECKEIEHTLSVARQVGRSPAILVGDFNCSETISPCRYRRIIDSGYLDVFATLVGRDAASDVTWDANNTLNAAGRFRNSPSQRIDHVFIHSSLSSTVQPVASNIVFKEPSVFDRGGNRMTLSDHYGLLVELRSLK